MLPASFFRKIFQTSLLFVVFFVIVGFGYVIIQFAGLKIHLKSEPLFHAGFIEKHPGLKGFEINSIQILQSTENSMSVNFVLFRTEISSVIISLSQFRGDRFDVCYRSLIYRGLWNHMWEETVTAVQGGAIKMALIKTPLLVKISLFTPPLLH